MFLWVLAEMYLDFWSVDQNEGRFSTLAKRCFSLFFFDLRFGSKLKFVRCTPTDFTPGTAYMERSKDWIFLYLDFFLALDAQQLALSGFFPDQTLHK